MDLNEFLSGLRSYAKYDEGDFLKRSVCCLDTETPLVVTVKDDENAVLDKIKHYFGSAEIKRGEGFIAALPSSLFEKTRFGYGDLIEIIKRLRDPDGCPWDRQQTPSTIRTNILEEAYELVEAIDLNDEEKMQEECGDVLLQGAFVAVMADEDRRFDNVDVITALCKKLIGRHTHIFGKDKARNAEEALYYWEKAKAKEKSQKSVSDKLDSVPITFTALQRANKVQKIIKKTGFEFPSIEEAAKKIAEETSEFFSAPECDREKEGGDILFSVVNVLRMSGIDPELALNNTTKKFEKRFRYIISEAERSGRSVEDLTLEEMEAIYNKAKKEEK